MPDSNFLILLAEEADKRTKLFKVLRDEQTVIDLTARADSKIKAEKTQLGILQNLLRQTLAEDNKTISSSLADLLLERVGFHPVALVMELRKVMAYTGDRREITRDDIDLLVGRTRQEALFELTGALSDKNLPLLLTIASRLQENNVHPLAIVATLRNHARSLLLSKALTEQSEIGFVPSMSSQTFQQVCLTRLK
ncbi:MAG: DNA polymerase III subunit delta, partial [Desulfobulbus sp.]|nr:DNA polymerase III subunit delta [Desulfobulbus sp.]